MEPNSSNTLKKSALNIYWIASGILSLIGLGFSLYAIYHHVELKNQGQTKAFCNINSFVNCDAVSQSAFSEIYGIPLGVFGAGFFLAILIFSVTGILNLKSTRENGPAHAFLNVLGVAASAVLGLISLIFVKALCLNCLGIYICCLSLGVLTFIYRQDLAQAFTFSLKNLFNGLTGAGAIVASAVLLYNFTVPKPEPHEDLSKKSNPHPNLLYSAEKYDIPIDRSAFSGLGEDFRKGSDQAPIVIVEFADFQCPACGEMSRVLMDLEKEMVGQVQIVFKNFQLSSDCNKAISRRSHEAACKIAIMARCAGLYGKFWPYYETAFANQQQASETQAEVWAKNLGLTAEQISSCRDSPDLKAKIENDAEIGTKLQVNSTPTVYINGHKYQGNIDSISVREAISSIQRSL